MSLIRKNIAWKTLGTAIEKGLRLVLVGVVARALGTRVYGQYTYAVAVAMLAVQVADMGLGLYLAREVARADVPPPRLIGQVLTLKGALAIGYVILLGLLTWWHFVDPDARYAVAPRHHASALAFTIALVGLSHLGTSAIEVIWQVFRGIQRLELEARSGAFFAAAQLVTTFGAIAGMDLWFDGRPETSLVMVAVAVAMAAASALGAYHAVRLLWPIVRPEFSWSREMLQVFRREVLPLGLAIVASLIYFKIDVPMLRWLCGDEATGVYSAAYKLLEVQAIVPSVLLAATFPALARTVIDNPREAQRLHRNTLLVLLGAGTVSAAVMLLLPEFAIRTLYGDQFGDAVPVLRALAPSVILTFVNFLETHMLVALGLVRAQMAFAVALIAVNVGANLLLMPRWGGVGAAMGTAVTEIVLLCFCAPLVQRSLRQRVAG